ncbi:hypothetical protein I5V04_06865 [Stenotrophomonas maltophilia]|nr:hypothetical protein [Stenotrophomonas maltophilia]
MLRSVEGSTLIDLVDGFVCIAAISQKQWAEVLEVVRRAKPISISSDSQENHLKRWRGHERN